MFPPLKNPFRRRTIATGKGAGDFFRDLQQACEKSHDPCCHLSHSGTSGAIAMHPRGNGIFLFFRGVLQVRHSTENGDHFVTYSLRPSLAELLLSSGIIGFIAVSAATPKSRWSAGAPFGPLLEICLLVLFLCLKIPTAYELRREAKELIQSAAEITSGQPALRNLI